MTWLIFEHCSSSGLLVMNLTIGRLKFPKNRKSIPQFLCGKKTLKTRAVRGSDYGPAIALSEEKDKLL